MLSLYRLTLMTATLHIIQIVSAIALIALVLLNRSTADTGSSFGDASFLHIRRGGERFLFGLTIVVAIVFALVSVAVIAVAR
jgi:protein translocase SecG subunit